MIRRVKNRVAAFREDPHLCEVARSALLALVLKVVGAGLAFGFNVAVARLLGAEGAGLYFLALSITGIASVVSSIGLNNALLKFAAAHAMHQQWGLVREVNALGIRMAVLVSGVISISGFVAAPSIANAFFEKPALAEPLRWMCLSILPFTLLNLYAQSLKGVKHIRDAMLIQNIGVPLICLLLVWPLANLASLQGVVWSYLFATLVVSSLGYWAWQNAIPRQMVAGMPFPISKLLESCKPLFIVSVAGEAVLPYAALLFLGMWASAEELGIFGAASRLALLMSFTLASANNAVAPKFAELYAINDKASLAKVARHSAAINTVLTIPIFVTLIFFGEEVMSIFGGEFRKGALILAVLSVGQFVNLMTGSVGYLLMMSGHEYIFRNLTIASALMLVVLLLVLVPFLGGLGAAIATATVVSSLNIAAVFYVRKMVGIDVVILPKWKFGRG